VEDLERGFSTFLGIKRRQEIIGEPGGVTVLDDFAHHPTSVAVTLDGLRQRFGARRLWAVWEPRSATSRRSHFQDAYAAAFGAADHVVVGAAYDQSRIPEEERFSPARLVEDLAGAGVDATALEHADEIAATIALRAHPGDVVAILSNGAFGGVHGKLLAALERRFGARG
jgi:UDP-N-acetylmuramate: L-alanyl-gamma-D-glutamyl-meso-diaminopimelate ligase